MQNVNTNSNRLQKDNFLEVIHVSSLAQSQSGLNNMN